jgi:YidC/Oxa1 family membrane protein insertase
MENRNHNGFFDGRTILAVVLVAVLFVGWQSYLNKKYPKVPVATEAVVSAGEASPANESKSKAGSTPAEVSNSASIDVPRAGEQEKLFSFQNSNISFEVSSKGMGLRNVVLKSLTDRDRQPKILGVSQKHSLYELSLFGTNEAVQFNILQKADNEFVGNAQVGTTQIQRTIRIHPETGAIENSVFISEVGGSFPGIAIVVPEKRMEGGSGSFFNPSMELQEFVIIDGQGETRLDAMAVDDEGSKKPFPGVSFLGIGTHYFASAIVDKSEIIPEAHIENKNGQSEILARLVYKPVPGQTTMSLNWLSYSGGKSLSSLEKIDPQLGRLVNFGFFSAIGNVLFKLLVWFHKVGSNWGLAIILLTLLVRILVLPLNIATFRSTKKMQVLQPIMNGLRERYKDDPQALNREMMAVWKEHSVNPLGGCLPMLLQLPIFFALYQVLGQSIELYQAPFFGWINDLSVKDPFFVLPALMTLCMFIQQKITPTTMDPKQEKIMQFLPLLFGAMMITLPAGLTLYIFINTLSGIILQQIFMRDRSTAVRAIEV